jgi:hypothetical protein
MGKHYLRSRRKTRSINMIYSTNVGMNMKLQIQGVISSVLTRSMFWFDYDYCSTNLKAKITKKYKLIDMLFHRLQFKLV